MQRNEFVEQAVSDLLKEIDLNASQPVPLGAPTRQVLRILEQITSHPSASVRLAMAYLLFYSLRDKAWDFRRVPVGTRGQYGDKRLAEQLTRRRITFHSAITAFGENLGWKGNIKHFDLSSDPRFSSALRDIGNLSTGGRKLLARHLAFRIAETKMVSKPVPPLDPSLLSFVRATLLFEHLLAAASSGHIQQFLVAALLFVHRRRFGLSIRTHHPHASDKFDGAAGDIEEARGEVLVRAYEVTVRSDWKNRLNAFRQKMESFKLTKYVIIAAHVRTDNELREPAEMLRFLEPIGKDIAILDIAEFCRFMAMELTADELREAINKTHDYLLDSDLCGVPEYQNKYYEIVREWLTESTATTAL